MQPQRKKKNTIGSALGWLIFLLIIGGGPAISTIWPLVTGRPAPANILPYLIGGLVALSIIVSAARSVIQASTRRGDTSLPTGMPPRTNTPMPPFGGSNPASRLPSAPRLPPSAFPPSQPSMGMSRSERVPVAPRFDPIINPLVVIVGVVGLVLLGAAVLLLLGQSLP